MFYFCLKQNFIKLWEVLEIYLRIKITGWYRRCISGIFHSTRYNSRDSYLSTTTISMDFCLVFHTKTYYTRMNINWHITYVYFNDANPSIEFKFNEYTPLVDLKYILHNLLSYRDNRKIMKVEYRSPSINNEWNIKFINFELKTNADARLCGILFSVYKQKLQSRWMRRFQNRSKIL